MSEERVLDLSACALRSYEIPQEWRDSMDDNEQDLSRLDLVPLYWVTPALVVGVTIRKVERRFLTDRAASVVCVASVGAERLSAVRWVGAEAEWVDIGVEKETRSTVGRLRKREIVTTRTEWDTRPVSDAWSRNLQRVRDAEREVAEWVDARR